MYKDYNDIIRADFNDDDMREMRDSLPNHLQPSLDWSNDFDDYQHDLVERVAGYNL